MLTESPNAINLSSNNSKPTNKNIDRNNNPKSIMTEPLPNQNQIIPNHLNPNSTLHRQALQHTSKILNDHFRRDIKTDRYQIHGDWYLTKLLGSGAYGEVHQAIEIKSGDKYAIKLDSRSNQEIDREIEFLRKLNHLNSKHIPQICEYGRFSGVSYFVMSILGTSLSELKKHRNPQKFSLSSSLRIGRQMIKALHDVHSYGIIHRDIKPANFVIGYSNPKTIYLIDFGLASEFNTGPERKNIGFRGTNTYASIRVHQYKDPGRCDDLVSWFYCFLRIMGMKFPWDKIKIPPKTERLGSNTIDTLFERLNPAHLEEYQSTCGNIKNYTDKLTGKVTKEYKSRCLKEDRKKIQDQFLIEKRRHPLKTLLKTAESKFGIDYSRFSKLTSHLDSLKFADTPNYQLIDHIFERALMDLNIDMNDAYDWEMREQ